jgi:hypothetical protein
MLNVKILRASGLIPRQAPRFDSSPVGTDPVRRCGTYDRHP